MTTANLLEYALDNIRQLALRGEVPCKICGGSTFLFDVVDFSKTCNFNIYPSGLSAIPVYYRRCRHCGFIFTDFFDRFTPDQWGEHIYNDAYKDIDPEYLEARPRANAQVVDGLLRSVKKAVIGLDYGGGSGRTTEYLRALGYTYDTYDPFGQSSVNPGLLGHYNFCSAFEVAEHTQDPVGFVAAIVGMADKERVAILIGTQVHERTVSLSNRLGWWYAAPRNGHISLYSKKSLQLLAAKFGLEVTSFSPTTHLMTRGYGRYEAYRFLLVGKVMGKLRSLKPSFSQVSQ